MARRMMVTALMIAGAVCAGVFWDAGPAYAGKIKFDMPQEMTGFVGTLVAKAYDVNVPGDKWSPAGWVAIGDIRVFAFDPKNKAKASMKDLAAAWTGKFANVGAKDGKVTFPEGLKVGDWVVVECFQNEGHLRASKMISYKPGEDEPDCYAFLKKEQKGNKVTVTLKKITEEKTATLALEKAPGDTMVPRADLLKTLDGLEPGAVIIVDLDHNTLKGIKPYESPKKGQFVKTAGLKSGDKFLPGVQFKDDAGADQTIAFVPKNATELSREAHALKAGAAVLYRTETDDKGTWLTAIWPEP